MMGLGKPTYEQHLINTLFARTDKSQVKLDHLKKYFEELDEMPLLIEKENVAAPAANATLPATPNLSSSGLKELPAFSPIPQTQETFLIVSCVHHWHSND